MEKKTFGQFLAQLRHSKGWTQKELGEKLFVSDKTVSRWERDECTPDLDLIPAIAEIFGITTDELLRREKHETPATPPQEQKNIDKNKQFNLVLHNHKKKYNNLSLISVGLSIVGLITAVICNVGFSRGLLGFCLASIFFSSAIISQICFTINCSILIDENEKERIELLKKNNTRIILSTVKILFMIWELWAFCLPIAVLTLKHFNSYYGLGIDSWLLFGALFACIAFLVAFWVYKLYILKILIRKEIVWLTATEKEFLKAEEILIKKFSKIFLFISLIVFLASITVSVLAENGCFKKIERFSTAEEFIERVQKDYDEWFEEGYPDPEYSNTQYPQRKWAELEGIKFYYNPNLYYIFSMEDYKLITKESYANEQDIIDTLNTLLIISEMVNLCACTILYYKKSNNLKYKTR